MNDAGRRVGDMTASKGESMRRGKKIIGFKLVHKQ